jgi:hypothetical protein
VIAPTAGAGVIFRLMRPGRAGIRHGISQLLTGRARDACENHGL